MKNTYLVNEFKHDLKHPDGSSINGISSYWYSLNPGVMEGRRVCRWPGLVGSGEFLTLSSIPDVLRHILSHLNLTIIEGESPVNSLAVTHYTKHDEDAIEGLQMLFQFPNRLKMEMFLIELEKVNAGQITWKQVRA